VESRYPGEWPETAALAAAEALTDARDVPRADELGPERSRGSVGQLGALAPRRARGRGIFHLSNGTLWATTRVEEVANCTWPTQSMDAAQLDDSSLRTRRAGASRGPL